MTFKVSPLSLFLGVCLSVPAVHASTQNLDKIVVTANKTEQTPLSVTANISIITAEEIEQKHYQTLDDAVKTLPGITIKKSGGSGQQTSIFLRGASSSDRQVLILQDGIELTDPSGFGASIANIQLSNVERIEIIKGPQSGTWGANASAGVINIITKKGGKHASVNLKTGSFNTKVLSSTLGAGNDKVDFLVHFNQHTTDGFSVIRKYNESQSRFENDAFKQTDVGFKLGLSPVKNHRFETTVNQTAATADYDSGSNPDDTTSNSVYDSTTRQLQYLYSGQAVSTKLFVQEHHIERTLNDANYGTSQYKASIEEYGGQATLEYRSTDQLTVSANSKHYRNIGSKQDFYNTGVGANNTNLLTDTLVLTEALRYDEFNRFENATTGKIGLKNHFTSNVFVGVNYGTGYNVPSLYQLSTNNPVELKPESIEGYDVTLGAYNATLTYFKSTTEDLITAQGSWPSNYYANAAGKTLNEGVEFDYRQTLKAIETDFGFNATWLNARNKDNQVLAYHPEQTANLTFDYFGLPQTQIGLVTHYTGTVYSADDRQGAQIGEYFVTDLTANFHINSHLSLYGQVLNLFNQQYVEGVVDYPATNSVPNYVYSTGGLQAFLGIKGNL
ncbi:TonB-dependent receptor [Hydrogenovibrio sp. 3SP14C1]|uniref:TonB-dependent receptor plug domain-containing protein n=1 Tax=Hydrogenovibrio sp. 3SP14C1 TaxID=3038774 RepID=UPI002415A67E|nr:TonB-dependent receptor [Hydrogenovibrio sp. 3SP14C1]MDG4812419.1 TonB-dependent receptor [Hydrogenovibrio sp. 3SP14C1]